VSTADHILDQIDNALTDYAVSDDAMRSAPAAEVQTLGALTRGRTLQGRGRCGGFPGSGAPRT
jgi:hypothetical protein